ncbi:hypothetical protein K440DRAFT_646102 [Wilcoxina mikolae CBS 423.85]|nr:hypothetical protein K440DRAFT_646102 [Wilcoxina mikolae CBS 423.85]
MIIAFTVLGVMMIVLALGRMFSWFNDYQFSRRREGQQRKRQAEEDAATGVFEDVNEELDLDVVVVVVVGIVEMTKVEVEEGEGSWLKVTSNAFGTPEIISITQQSPIPCALVFLGTVLVCQFSVSSISGPDTTPPCPAHASVYSLKPSNPPLP